jgi:hypothetical protein
MPANPRSMPSEPNPDTESPESGNFEKDWESFPAQNLTDNQIRAIELTVQGHSDTQIAQMLSINRKTLWNWKNLDEDYREALAEARLQIHASVTDRYENIVFKATGVLVKFLEDPTDKNRMKAAQILLTLASRYKPASRSKRQSCDATDDDWPAPELPPKVG